MSEQIDEVTRTVTKLMEEMGFVQVSVPVYVRDHLAALGLITRTKNGLWQWVERGETI